MRKIKGMYGFTPMGTKALKVLLSPHIHSMNLTKLGDEFFRTMKVAADYERVINGQKPVHGGLINTEGMSNISATAKIGHEFFVDNTRKSAFDRVAGLLIPFWYWFSRDALHAVRYIKNNPKKALTVPALIAGAQAWNNIGDRKKQEESLPEWKREIPHINTGLYDEQGNPKILYLNVLMGQNLLNLTGVPALANEASDVATGRKTVSQAGDEVLGKMGSEISRGVGGLIGPLKTGAELWANKSAFTGNNIIPESLKGTKQGFLKQLDYALGSVIPNYRAMTTAGNQMENATNESPSLADKALKTAENQLSFWNRIYKVEDKKSLAKQLMYDLSNEQKLAKNRAYQDVNEAIANGLITGDYSQLDQVAQKEGLDPKGIQSHAANSWSQILKLALTKTDDPKKIAELKAMLEGSKLEDVTSLYKQIGVENPRAKQAYTTIQGGGQ